MASSSFISFSCAPSLFSTKSINHSFTRTLLSSPFLGAQNLKLRIQPARLRPSNRSRATCWFKFGKNGVDAESAGIYDVFQLHGDACGRSTYSKMEALLNLHIHPIDILLMLAATEGDKPKIEALVRAGASYTVKDADGRTALDRANTEEIRDLFLGYSSQKA